LKYQESFIYLIDFLCHAVPKGSEEPTIPRNSGEELDEVKINLLPLGLG
jgi:hypothetical protein